MSSSSCTFFEKIKEERLGTNKEVIPNYGNRFEVYFGTTTVGWCDYIYRSIDYSDYDSELEERFEEEIVYRNMRYKFIYILYNRLVEIQVLRYDKDGVKFKPIDSYAISNNVHGVFYKYFGEDGVTVVKETQIMDPSKIANTQELYNFCNNYLTTYQNMIRDRKGRDVRKNRVQSLSYDLLKFERM